ncbi:uncharacterized protein Tco025E_09112, partial [Trypanosoma conorhini]
AGPARRSLAATLSVRPVRNRVPPVIAGPREEASRGDAEREAREESRAARDRRAREDASRGDAEREAREESRAARDRRAREDESRGDAEREAREESRAARDRRAREDESRGDAEREVREESRRRRAAREEAHTGLDDEGESLRRLTSRLDALEQKLRKVGAAAAASSQQASGAHGRSSVSPTEVVDEQAREDLEELERFVTRRFKELEKAVSKFRDAAPAAVAAPMRVGGHSTGRSERSPAGRAAPSPESGATGAKRSSEAAGAKHDTAGASDARQREERRAPAGAGAVDQVARGDAGAALEQVGHLEKFVTRKLKELSLAIGKELGPFSVRPSGETEYPTAMEQKPQGPLVDQMARDDAARSIEAVHELEEEWGRRWHSLEERLRIIGRASIGKGTLPPTAAASSIDRKAREDASMSLMRIQQLEREIMGFRRLLQKHELTTSSDEFAPSDTRLPSGAVFPVPPKVPRQAAFPPAGKAADDAPGSHDAEYQTRMQNLEQEVEQRMQEVNRALATLRTTQSGLPPGNLLGEGVAVRGEPASVPGQVVFNSRDTDGYYMVESAEPFHGSPTTQKSMLVMTSHEDADVGNLFGGVAPVQGAAIVLRSPQLGGLGVPLVKRELPGGTAAASHSVLRTDEAPARQMGRSYGAATELPPPREDSVAQSTLHDEGGLRVAEAASGAAAATLTSPTPVSTPTTAPTTKNPNARLPAGDGGWVSPRDRTGELDLLRSHSTRLRSTAVSPRVKMEEGFLEEQSALGHTTPCVVYNCAWCAAQKRKASARTARPVP